EPGSLLPLPPGADVKFSSPVEPVRYNEYLTAHLRAVAAAVGVPYEHVSGDYEGVTYSSVRAALVEYRRRIESYQFHYMVRQFCRPVWRRFITLSALAGTIPADSFAREPEAYLAAEWLPPRFDFVDPKKDAEAEVLLIERGLKSRAMAVAERGYDVEEIDRQIAADRDRARELGLSFAPPSARRPAPAESRDE
ncbi:MAG: phage portal protein, partial [Acetobacteraceae bacterium]